MAREQTALREPEPITKDIVLVGGGHAHVLVLRSFAMKPEPGVRLTLIAKELSAAYSGMLPGFVAGHYTLEECQIDLVRLAQAAGARLVHGEANGVDRTDGRVLIEGRPQLRYDLLSIDVGITPDLDDIEGAAEHAIVVKPVSVFAPKWQAFEQRALLPGGARNIAVIGGGAAGVELVLAARHRLASRAPGARIEPGAYSFTLIAGGALLASHSARARGIARQALAAAGVVVIEGVPATAVTAGSVRLAGGRTIPADGVLISTKATAPSWFAATGLARDPAGFLAVRPSLQALDDDTVFAVGDCASVIEHPREKSGVFAVRQGPILAENLRRLLNGKAVRPFVPQRRFLSLVSLGDKRALASRGTFALSGAWAWWWKDRIDRGFMDKFNTLPFMEGGERARGTNPRCGGCAAKVGPATLARALDRLDSGGRNNKPASRDDAAVLDEGFDTLRLETVDFFRAFWPDPYLLGQIAANHAMGDIFAMGGTPRQAQAVAVMPFAAPRIVEDDLFQLLAGARSAFDRDGVMLIGGHSSEGAELSVGFAISGAVSRHGLIRKGGLRPGDQLILTRPLGTGLLFAAQMRGLAKAGSIEAALAAMRQSNRAAAAILAHHGATAMTDVTGFGLAGHLVEMVLASRVRAILVLDEIPVYPQALDLAQTGIASTLVPENLALGHYLARNPLLDDATLAVLFDPQTSGGLLAGVPADAAQACLAALRTAGMTRAARIGEARAAPAACATPIAIVGALVSG